MSLSVCPLSAARPFSVFGGDPLCNEAGAAGDGSQCHRRREPHRDF